MIYAEQVERVFDAMEKTYHASRRNGTSAKDVLRLMVERENKIWWWSWEFVGQALESEKRLSHRAPARASDLALHAPWLVEDRRIGRFKIYRAKKENTDKVFDFLNSNETLKEHAERITGSRPYDGN